MSINALINNNRDKYLSLLIQNGEKLPPNFDVSTIMPPGIRLNLHATQMSNASTTTTSTQIVAPSTQMASTQLNKTQIAISSIPMLGVTPTRFQSMPIFNSQASSTPQVTMSVSTRFATSSQGIQHGHTNPFRSTQANTMP